jgi:hypothetical protein
VSEEVDDDDRLEENEAVEVVDEEAAPVSDGLADADRLGEKEARGRRGQTDAPLVSDRALTTMTGSAKRTQSWSWKPLHRR